ncbi:excalibur calcium-binding domain-containing protein [Sphingomonas psychrotolerans]|uniref:Excalibur calcium-binding domain-containing protein n=1 Tax=Sphingomonas psychrotolerans TaxID=1327635 RepID=A0ABU3N2J6_9SPHN|nr:excalibur calcium-binding domain-containing protein [Sphingomonas psychrotolerans]MDT8758757.1 excalibur calcium-binding domain-containing protein [Sphingomonas psychrotolerans]
MGETSHLPVVEQNSRMGFRKPFRAEPVRLGAHYRRKQRGEARVTALRLLGLAGVAGVLLGAGSVAISEGGAAKVSGAAKAVAVSTGMMRARQPQTGDYWSGCNEAREAGAAPIYAGEPGYREGLDGDSDGIACEPYRGA